jgi:hypothetical protein
MVTMYLISILPLVLFQVASFKFDVRIHQGREWEACYDNGSAVHVHEVKSFRYLASSDGHETSSSVDGVLHLVVVLRDGAVKAITTPRLYKDWLESRMKITLLVNLLWFVAFKIAIFNQRLKSSGMGCHLV